MGISAIRGQWVGRDRCGDGAVTTSLPGSAAPLTRLVWPRHHPVIAGRVDERFIIPALTAISLVTNIVGHATDAVSDEVQLRVIAYSARVDAHLGAQVSAGLGDGTAVRVATSPRRWPRSSAGRANRA